VLRLVVDDGGPLTLSFSLPVLFASGFFTYTVPITVSAFDAGAMLLGSVTSAFSSNLALSDDAGSSPNELLSLTGLGNITKVTITGDPAGSSLVVDNLQFGTVPEPTTFLLLSSGLLLLFWSRRYTPIRR